MQRECIRIRSDRMLQTQLQKLASQGPFPDTVKGPNSDAPSRTKVKMAPPTLFCQPPTPTEEDDPFEEVYLPSHQMTSFIPERFNRETYFTIAVDRLAFNYLFKAFAKFGTNNKPAETMSLTNSDKWLRQAKVIDNCKISTTDTGIYFRQFARAKKALPFREYEQYLDFLARKKSINPDRMKYMMTTCGLPKPSKIKRQMAYNSEDIWNEDKLNTRVLTTMNCRNVNSLNFQARRNRLFAFSNESPRNVFGYPSEHAFCGLNEAL